MNLLKEFVDIVLHVDEKLADLIRSVGSWTYVILFAIIFVETGLVIMPFLPGDSLLFAAGAVAGTTGELNVVVIILSLILAAFLGNTVNFLIGSYVGPKFLEREKVRFIKKKHLDQTKKFYDKHGAKAIIISRFLPIFRTFVPFIAGIGRMNKPKFLFYNLVSAILWVVPITLAGYFLGRLPWVQHNFEYVILSLIAVSMAPAVIGFIRGYLANRREQAAAAKDTVSTPNVEG